MLKNIILSIDSSLIESPTRLYVTFKKNKKKNTVSLWPKDGWIEVVLAVKLGQINDENDLVYDISNRKWSSSQYAFKFYDNTDLNDARDIIRQTIELKNKDR